VLASLHAMRHFAVNAASWGVREADRALGVRIVRHVALAGFLAAAVACASVPDALAANRSTSKQSSNANASAAPQSGKDSGRYERKCVIMSCGTPWCFSVKR
jgi:hypothetical protein